MKHPHFCCLFFYVLAIGISCPDLTDLMNDVAAEIPSKWRSVGIQLKLQRRTLDTIQHENAGMPDSNIHSFEQVFTEWKKQKTSPHTWETIINALRAPAVGEIEVADTVHKKHCI